MAKYFALLGRRVEVQYRAGDISLPATGKLVADSGRSIFLEERLSVRGSVKIFRWEIPYQCIVRLAECPSPEPAAELPELVTATTAEAGWLPLRKNPKPS